MARRALLCLALTASAVGLWAGSAPAGAIGRGSTSATAALERDVLSNVNLLRHQHGLGALRLSAKLAAAARLHSTEMAQRGYFSHDSANGTSFDKRIARFYSLSGKHYWSVGENLLWSSPDVSASSALDMWLNSPEHKKILLTARWREIGLSAVHMSSAPGTYGGREVTIVTADFGVRR
ncbi:MAG: CAP domain-containing protein [Actinobacteria bacterium]|nr:MAG: CAP domain-containing protein [Actinomycetota bacterium]TML89044.1 MAG: CAP domain-containing protein [Actinomycetota bacterium]